MSDFSPTLLYRGLDEHRLAVFVGERVDADDLYAFHRRLADFILRHGIATVVLAASDPDILGSFAEWGVEINHIVIDADLAAVQPNRPSLFSLARLTDARPLSLAAYKRLAEAADRAEVRALLGQRLAGQVLLCYGVDPNQAWSIPAAAGWPGIDRQQPVALVWEQAIDTETVSLLAQVFVVGRDPFDLLHEAQQQAFIDDDSQSKGADDVDYDPHHGGSSPTDVPPPSHESIRLRAETLRIDAAVPERVEVNRAFVLAVAVRQLTSPRLAEDDLTVMASGEAQVVFAGEGPIRLRLRVSAPDCKLDGPDTFAFRLAPKQELLPTFYFNLTPTRAGKINIIVQLFQEDEFLGSSRLATQAETEPSGQVELVGRAELAGQVQVVIQSQALMAPPPDSKQKIEELDRQYQDASMLLTRLKGELLKVPHGEAYVLLETRIAETEETIKQLGREIEELQ